jgi:CHASE2 domain-containing sensor protein
VAQAKASNRRLILRVGALTLVILVFDQTEILQRLSASLFQRLFGSSKPMKYADGITVVLADAASLAHLQQPFPPTREFHAEVLQRLVQLEPKALFVDVWFDASLDAADPVATSVVADVLREARSPVLIAGDPQRPGGGVGDHIRNAADAVVPVVARRSVKDLMIRNYDLRDGAYRCSAALLLYQIARNPGRDPGCGTLSSDGMSDPLEVLWHTTPAAENARTLGCTGLPEKEGFCPPLRTVLAASLFSTSTAQQPGEPWIHERLVLYGLSSDAFGDRIDTPVARGIPGIYLHAMALQNLLAYESRYAKTPRAMSGRWIVQWLLYGASIVALAFLRARFELRRLRTVSLILIGLCVVLCTTLLLYYAVDIGPSHWITVWLLWIAIVVSKGVEDPIKGLLKKGKRS